MSDNALKNVKFLLAATLILALSWMGLLLASPYLELRSLRSALNTGDAELVSEKIDMAQLKASARDQMKKQVLKDLTNSPEDMKAAREAVALLGPLVDQLITKDHVMAMLKGQKFDATGAPMTGNENTLVAQRLDGNVFALHSAPKNSPDAAHLRQGPRDISFIFTRQQGLSWRVTQIIFPE